MIKIVHSQLDHTDSLRLLGSVVCGRHRQVVKFVGGPWLSLSVALLSVAVLIVFSLGGEPGKGKEGDDLEELCIPTFINRLSEINKSRTALQ